MIHCQIEVSSIKLGRESLERRADLVIWVCVLAMVLLASNTLHLRGGLGLALASCLNIDTLTDMTLLRPARGLDVSKVGLVFINGHISIVG